MHMDSILPAPACGVPTRIRILQSLQRVAYAEANPAAIPAFSLAERDLGRPRASQINGGVTGAMENRTFGPQFRKRGLYGRKSWPR